MGNAIVSADGKSVVPVGDMLCLRLWHDPDARPTGKVKGQWYADPVYKADIPAIKDGSYVPRIAKAHIGRKSWQPIPERVIDRGEMLSIYLGDLVVVDGKKGRFAGLDIDDVGWSFIDPLSRKKMAGMLSIGKIGNETELRVIRETLM